MASEVAGVTMYHTSVALVFGGGVPPRLLRVRNNIYISLCSHSRLRGRRELQVALLMSWAGGFSFGVFVIPR